MSYFEIGFIGWAGMCIVFEWFLYFVSKGANADEIRDGWERYRGEEMPQRKYLSLKKGIERHSEFLPRVNWTLIYLIAIFIILIF